MPSLNELLAELPDARVEGDGNIEVATIAYDSREVSAGAAFVAIRGFERDGHDFIASAVERGASVVVADNEAALESMPDSVTRVLVPDTRHALAMLACEFYGHPSRELTLVGVTGTNGKTTVAHLVAELLREQGYKSVGIIGTLGALRDGDIRYFRTHHARKFRFATSACRLSRWWQRSRSHGSFFARAGASTRFRLRF